MWRQSHGPPAKTGLQMLAFAHRFIRNRFNELRSVFRTCEVKLAARRMVPPAAGGFAQNFCRGAMAWAVANPDYLS
jgi:hypothetical protein